MLLCLLTAYFSYLLISISRAQPVDINTHIPFTTKSDRSWFWGWAWGAESTVSVVGRSPVVSFPSRPAAFGAEINDPLLGYVIPLNSFTEPCRPLNASVGSLEDNSGCPDLCLRGSNQPTETWIALVQRGNCEFIKKVREAQRLGAQAVVVGGQNPDTSGHADELVNMYSPEDSSDIKIAATYIKYSDYMQLYSLIAQSNTSHSGLRTLSLLITAEYSAWEWYSPIITFIVILLLPSVLTFVTLLIHRIRAARAAQRDRAPVDIVKRLPWRVWTGNGWEKHEGGEACDDAAIPPASSSDVDLEERVASCEVASPAEASETDDDASTSHPANPSSEQPWFETQQECAICLSEFAKGDKVRVLPCHHIFHLDEVDEWLIHRKKLCPICKADVTQPANSSHRPHLVESYHTESNSGNQPLATPTSPLPQTLESTPTERTPLLNTGSGAAA